MALLQQLKTGLSVRPASRCLVGRAPNCHLVLNDESVSREHAVLFYDGRAWQVRDLSSRNGTLVDGGRVVNAATLHSNSVLQFGTGANAWQLVDAEPPQASAISLTTGSTVLSGASGLCLPGEEDCEAFICRQEGRWMLERDGDVDAVADQQTLMLKDDAWRLCLTLGEDNLLAPTAALAAESLRLLFKVSRDEEHVELTVFRGERAHVFPHRSHLYLLLLLARARLDDQRSVQLSSAEHGWLETKHLAEILRTTSEGINVGIFRARKQIQELDAELAGRLVDRRPLQARLRIGISALSVTGF